MEASFGAQPSSIKSAIMKLFVAFLLLLPGAFVHAQLPQRFNYQAVVRSNGGAIVANQQVRISFSIHDGSANGPIQYSETHSATTNVFGLINLQVGTGTVVSGSFTGVTWNSGHKFLEVAADITGGTNYTNLSTVELVAVPYALQADQANKFSGNLAGDVVGSQNNTVIKANAVNTTKLADNAVTDSKLADNAVTSAKLSNNSVTTAKLTDNVVTSPKLANNSVTATKIAGNAIVTAHLTDNVISTNKIADSVITSPKIASGQIVRSVNGLTDDIVLAAGNGATFSTNGNTITINGTGGDITGITAGAGLTGGGAANDVTLSANFSGNGTSNSVSRSDHTHVGQSWTVNSGSVLRMFNTGPSGYGLYTYTYGTGFSDAAISAQVLATTGQSIGVFGATTSNDQMAAGIFGQATRNGAAKGVWGLANGDGTFGIFGQAQGTNSWAGYFQGRVHVNGTLSKAAGSFKIDHPLDPANKYLSHSFVESPDMMNIYNGNITLDANGEATVTLPDWFEALNMDFRYQLTAVGKASPNVYIAQEIAGNRFRIAGGAAGGKISWMVTGVRHDAYANAHRIPVEEPKQANERGTYLTPPTAGKSVIQGLGAPAVVPRSTRTHAEPETNQ